MGGRAWALPAQGMAPEDVLAALRTFQGQNPDLLSTIMSIGINYGGEELEAIRNQAHAMFSHDNNMVVDMRPGCLQIEKELMAICAGLLCGGSPDVVTTISSGGTESIFNGVHAAKTRARRLRGDGFRPKWIAGWCAHPAISKACHYLDIELVRVPDKDYRADADAMAAAVDDRTIGLYASAPSWPFGRFDDIPALGRLALEQRSVAARRRLRRRVRLAVRRAAGAPGATVGLPRAGGALDLGRHPQVGLRDEAAVRGRLAGRLACWTTTTWWSRTGRSGPT